MQKSFPIQLRWKATDSFHGSERCFFALAASEKMFQLSGNDFDVIIPVGDLLFKVN